MKMNKYHQFVVREFANAFGVEPADIIEMMALQWISANPHQVKDAGASISNWRECRAQESTDEK